METVNTVYLNCVRSGPAHVRAHGVEEVCKVDYMRLTRRIFNDRAALCKRCGEYDIHRRADRDLIEIYSCAVQLAAGGVGIHEAVFNINGCAERGHALDMLVNGTHAEVAAAGHRGLCAAETAEHCADEIIRCADLAHEIIRGILKMHIRAVDLNSRSVYIPDICTEIGQNSKQHVGIAYLRQILYAADAVYHERCRDYRNSRVLCAAYLNLTVQCRAAINNIFIQNVHLPILSRAVRARTDTL